MKMEMAHLQMPLPFARQKHRRKRRQSRQWWQPPLPLELPLSLSKRHPPPLPAIKRS
jgi:hypothetical protein